jgi:AcrR family transcriptional regulator
MKAKGQLPRKEREHQRRRSEILETALRLFVSKGYHEVSMREVAAEAEFATGTLYKFFESKERLYAELVKTYSCRLYHAIMLGLDTKGDEREKIAGLIRAHARVLTENAIAVQLYFRQTQGFGLGLTDPEGEVSRLREEGLQRIMKVLSSGIRKGVFRDVPVRQAAIALSGILESMVYHGLRDSPSPSADEMAAMAETMFFRGMLAERSTERG